MPAELASIAFIITLAVVAMINGLLLVVFVGEYSMRLGGTGA